MPLRKGKRGKRGQNAEGERLQKGRTFKAGEDRTLEKVVLARCKFVAEVDRRRRTQRSVRSPLHPIWGAYGDGSLDRSQQAGASAQRGDCGRKGAEGRIEAETHHVTATRDRYQLAQVRGRPSSMEGTSDCSG